MSKTRKRDAIELFLSQPPVIVASLLSQLRYLILVDGLGVPEGYDTCPYRCYVWSVLLRVKPAAPRDYATLVEQGPPAVYAKIRHDTVRTLPKDLKFQKKVPEAALIRLLSSYAWVHHFTHKTPPGVPPEGYVQGMNVLAAPFLYACRSEPQAFALFERVVGRCMPLYIKPTLDGVHTGLALVDLCLKLIDREVYDFLQSKLLKAEIYAFALVLTLSACTPPLSEVLVLWDFLFAYGVHMNILFVVAQLVLARNAILELNQPMSVLRLFPLLNARDIIKLAVSFVAQLPEEVYKWVVQHPFDPAVAAAVKKGTRNSRRTG